MEETKNIPETEVTEEGAAQPEEESLLTVKYNHQIKALSRADATAYDQKGMLYDSVSPMLESLKYVAASEGKNLTQFVEAIRKQHDDNAYAALLDRCGGDEEIAKELWEVEKGKHQSAYQNLLDAEKQAETETEEAITRRLADELAAVQAEFPDVRQYSDLPAAVIREADEKGVTLLDALLRHNHREQRKSDAAKASQAAAAKASAGDQASTGSNEGNDPVINALMKGIWG